MLLKIEKLIYGGDGLARLPADDRGPGKAVFVPFVLAGETVQAAITEQKPSFVRAHAETILEPAPDRAPPLCPYFGSCGGCHYQHASYEHQLEIKKEILRETLRRTAKMELPFDIEVHASPPWNYRNRSRLQVNVNPAFAVGYFKLESHELLPVEECPISSALINRGIASLWRMGRASKVPHGVREVEFFANAADTQLLVTVGCAREARRANVRGWAEDWRAALPEIAGIIAFREPNPGDRKAGPQEILVSVGASSLAYQTQRGTYRVSAGSFFQTNRHLIDELVKIVTGGYSGKLALDLYAGVGLFSTTLACDFDHIVSVESSQTSSVDLSYNRPTNGEAVQATTEQYLVHAETTRRFGKGADFALIKPDLVVVDPPRSGLGERVTRMVTTLGASRVAYVSCDPATLARDMVIMLAAGYQVEQLHLVDLFPQTYHVESIVHLRR